MKAKYLFTLLLLGIIFSFKTQAQKGEVWPIYSSQSFDLDSNLQITQEYETKNVCSFFMFINNNEFLHVTDNITSLYKIIKRQEDGDNVSYTVVSEIGNVYVYSFNKVKKDVVIISQKGYGNYYKCLTPYNTVVFDNLNR